MSGIVEHVQRRLFAFAWLWGCITCALMGAPAHAQVDPADTARPLIDAARVEAFAATLDEARATIVLDLYETYVNELNETWLKYLEEEGAIIEELRARREAKPDMTPAEATRAAQERFHPRIQDRRRYARSRLDTFVSDVRTILADDADALARWEGVVKNAWRERLVRMINPGGQTIGRINLIPLTEAIALNDGEREGLKPVVAAYGEALDAILLELESGFIDMDDRAHRTSLRLAQGDADAAAEMREIVEWFQSFGARVAELNRRYTPLFAQPMTGTNAYSWGLTVESASYGPLFAKSPVDGVVEALREHEGIDTALMTTIESHYAQYLQERDALRIKASNTLDEWAASDEYEALIAESQRRHKAYEAGDRTANPQQVWEANPVLPMLHQLLDMERRATELLKATLGEERIKALPIHVRWLLAWDTGLEGID